LTGKSVFHDLDSGPLGGLVLSTVTSLGSSLSL